MNITPEIYKLINDIVEDKIRELKIQREEFESLKAVIEKLTEAHEKAIERLSKLESTVEELVKAHERVLERLDKVEKRLDRLERIVEELAEAQKKAEERLSKVEERLDKVEERLDRLERIVEELAEAQRKAEERLSKVEERLDRLEAAVEKLTGKMGEFERHLMALGARWGFLSEESFRNAMRDLLEDFGYEVDRVVFEDEEGRVFGSPSTIEIDVLIRDGKVIAVEIKSSISKADVGVFKRKVELYEELFKRKVDELMMVSPFVHPKAMTLAMKLGIRIATKDSDLE